MFIVGANCIFDKTTEKNFVHSDGTRGQYSDK